MPNDNTELRVIDDVRTAARDLPAGSRLPSVRELIARHRVSPVTVQRAIARLAAEGLVEPRPGRGTFVAVRPPAADGSALRAPDLSWQEVALGGRTVDTGGMDELLAIPAPGSFALSTGYLDPVLRPTAALGAALARAARRPGAWERLPIEGLAELRDWFATESGGDLRGHDFVVSSGGQSGLGTILRALAAPGDAVLVESPTYVGALAAMRNAGLRPVPVPSDADGVRPDLLADALRLTGARLVYLQPLYANPHGAVLAPERRAPVLEAVAHASAFLIEDDWARDMPIDGEPPPPLASEDPDGHVVYLRSLTKPAAPGLRVAGVGARGVAGARLRAARVIDDLFVSGPLQQAALDLVSSPAWRRHKRLLGPALRERRDVALAAVARALPATSVVAVPRGGLHFLLRLPEGVDDLRLAADARAAGVLVAPGRPLFAAEPPAAHLRITYAGVGPAELVAGIERLAEVAPALAG